MKIKIIYNRLHRGVAATGVFSATLLSAHAYTIKKMIYEAQPILAAHSFTNAKRNEIPAEDIKSNSVKSECRVKTRLFFLRAQPKNFLPL